MKAGLSTASPVWRYGRWVLLAFGLLLLFAFLRKRVQRGLLPALAPDRGDYATSGTLAQLTYQRKQELHALARELFAKTEGYQFWTSEKESRDQVFRDCVQLTDAELLYLAKFFKQNITPGRSLYSRVNAEWGSAWGITLSENGQQLLARLRQIGEGF